MITVWCMNTNNHAPESEVRTLKRQVDRHLTEPHIFICITEDVIDGITTLPPPNELPGWWGKLNLFSGQISHSRNLWLDLDVVITGNIDSLVMPLIKGKQLRIIRNWAQSGHGGCQSSVMFWEGDSARIISDTFDHKDAHWPPRNDVFWGDQVAWGDQEWITRLRDTGTIQVEYFDSAHVVSYKYHCQQGLPQDSLIQVFHGQPKPGDVADDWAKQCRA